MRLLTLLTALLLALPCWGEPATLFEGGLQVEVPAVFRALDQAAIDEIFAASRSKPSLLFATPDAETRISLTYTESLLTPDELDETRTVLKSKMESGAQVTWLRDEMITLAGSPWFRLDYELKSEGKREIIMGTVLRNRLLFLIVATPLEDWELMGPEIEMFTSSLRLDQTL